MKNNQIITILKSQGNYFRTSDLKEQGLSNYQITQLVEANILAKVYQGVYQLVDASELQIRDINVIVQNGIISFDSAVFYYELANGESGKITLTLDRNQKPPKMPKDLFNYYYTTSELFELGVNIIDQNGREIKIYDRERTICDLIKHRSKYENSFILEVVQNYLNYEGKNLPKLIDYSKQTRTHKNLIKILDEIGGYYGQF